MSGGVVSVIRAAVDLLPDTHAAPLDEAARTVDALVEALEDLCGVLGESAVTERAFAALRQAGVEL